MSDVQEQMKLAFSEQQKIEAKYANLRQDAIEKEWFPQKYLDEEWFYKAHYAMRYASPISAGISPEEFKNTMELTFDSPKTLNQVATLCNNFEKQSPQVLGFTDDNNIEEDTKQLAWYCELQIRNTKVSQYWNVIVSKIQDDLNKQRQDEIIAQKMVQKAQPFSVAKGDA